MSHFTLSGEVLVPGEARGVAVVTDTPLSLWGGLNPDTGFIVDRFHPLADVDVSGKVLVLPTGRGSCSASGVLLEASRNGLAPAGFVVSEVDPIIGLGAILSDELLGRAIPLILLKPEECERLCDGDLVSIAADGLISVDRKD